MKPVSDAELSEASSHDLRSFVGVAGRRARWGGQPSRRASLESVPMVEAPMSQTTDWDRLHDTFAAALGSRTLRPEHVRGERFDLEPPLTAQTQPLTACDVDLQRRRVLK